MTLYTLGGRTEHKEHAIYDSKTGTLTRRNGSVHWRDVHGGFQELGPNDFWGSFRQEDGQNVFFRNEKMYPDDPDRMVVWVDILGPTQSRLHYVWDGQIVEQVVYRRKTDFGANVYEAFEEDVDGFLFRSKEHQDRRIKWPNIFSADT